ncbi:MAG: FAD-binding oxidoreductase [Pirellula sp.]|nr:FAD-binding oxidoreductase [Pirellula sp.]
MKRRLLLKSAAAGIAAAATHSLSQATCAQEPGNVTVNDFSGLNPVVVSGEVRPSTVEELKQAIERWEGPLSIGGGRFSMGGQVAAPHSLHVDMRGLDRVVSYLPEQHVIRVQAGITWRSIQDCIDRLDQSVKIMQSFSNFTVGGSLSVNCHGRYVGRGPLVNSVRALQLLLPDGRLVEASRTENADLFRAVIGGYGGLGIVTEIELDLEDNCRIERRVKKVSVEEYPDWFAKNILQSQQVVLHNADLTPPDFDQPKAISWVRTERRLTDDRRLVPRGLNYATERNAIWAVSELPGGDTVRSTVERSILDRLPMVVWRNFEASKDTASVEPTPRTQSTYVLQEYFIPVKNFQSFTAAMAGILKNPQTGAINVSIRHAPADTTSLLSWAPVEVFCFVLYYKQRVTDSAHRDVELWTRELIEAALSNEGRYYLPYRLHATLDQFRRAYPEANDFAALKRRVDPQNRMRNLLWDRYLSSSAP